MFISLIIMFNSFMIRIDLLQFKWKRKNIRIIFKFRLWYSDYLSIQDGTWIWFLKGKRDFPLFISLIIIFNSLIIRIDLLLFTLLFISLIIIFNSFMIRIDLLQFKWKRKNKWIIFIQVSSLIFRLSEYSRRNLNMIPYR